MGINSFEMHHKRLAGVKYEPLCSLTEEMHLQCLGKACFLQERHI